MTEKPFRRPPSGALRRSGLCALLVVGLMSAGGSVTARSGLSGAAPWGDVTKLDDRLGWQPDIAIDPQGNATAVYGTEGGAVRAVRKPAGKPWREPVVLGRGREPQVLTDGAGVVHVAWRGGGPGPDDGFRLLVARHAGATGWSSPRYLSAPVASVDEDPSIPGVFDFDLAVAPGGAVIVVWNIARSHGEEVKRIESRYRPAGGSWLARQVHATGEDLPYPVEAAMYPDGDALVVHGTAADHVVARHRSASGQWSDPHQLFDSGYGVEVAIGGGVAVVTWGDVVLAEPAGAEPRWVRRVSAARLPAGGEWGPAQVLSPWGVLPAGLVVDRHGVATTGWYPDQENDIGIKLTIRRSQPDGTWSLPEVVSGRNRVYSAVLATNARGEVFVLFQAAATEDALLSARRPVSGGWSSLGPVAQHPYEYNVAVRAGGRAMAVWGMPDAVKARSSGG